ncbi:MAG TPA: ABC transporter ATP-binding protein, partial [Streptosporangiaceae bacterium]
TNDLDIETLTELEDLLDGWPGSMTVVSHDRYFLERVTDHVIALLGDARLAYLPGGVEQYLDRVRGTREASLPVLAEATPGEAAGPGDAAADRVARKELQRLERQIDRLTQREAALGVEMAEHASDYEKLTKLGADLRSAQADKAGLEERWLTVAGDLDG